MRNAQGGMVAEEEKIYNKMFPNILYSDLRDREGKYQAPHPARRLDQSSRLWQNT